MGFPSDMGKTNSGLVLAAWQMQFRGTPHLRIAEIVSLFVSAISALFNWYAMRRGTLLVGGEGGSFGGDLRRLPRLLFGFLASLPRRIVTKTILVSSKCLDGSLG